MKRALQGRYVSSSTLGETVRAFIPAPLPPHPPVEWTPALRGRFDEALVALGRLDGVAMLLPDVDLFIFSYVRKEAVLSSMIEGTQSSLADLLLYEAEQRPGVPLDDVREVSDYVGALYHGLRLLDEGLPICLRLIREIHEVLFQRGRGSATSPGEFRRSQNWIGGTRPGNARFVPPPPQKVLECMSALEAFLNDLPVPTPPLLKAALAHVQFETVHPFLDGNGRVGRLLITLMLCHAGVLRRPMLYLSLYFKTHRQLYYELLDRVRTEGNWEAWLEFFAEAVVTTAAQAVDSMGQLLAVADRDRALIAGLGRGAESVVAIHRALLERPLTTAGWLSEKTGITPATVNKALERLERLGIVTEVTGRKRNRVFGYPEYLEIVGRGTEL